MTVATTLTSKNESQTEKQVEVDFFHIDMIPDAMEKMKWQTAAKLMRHWFSIDPAFELTKKTKNELLMMDPNLIHDSQLNTDIVKMSWAMTFKQVNEGINKLSRVWNSPNGRRELKVKLGRKGCYEKECIRIGYDSNIKDLEANAQVNYLTIGSMLDSVDGWYGAMGTSTLKVCLQGFTTITNGKCFFIVEKLGFYLKDTYDFVDESSTSEPLGIWSKERILNKVESVFYMSSYASGLWGILAREFSGFVPVFNKDFRRWQDKHNSGGDFIILSDVLWMDALPKDRVIEL
ncbi:DUF6402 family protein [Enterobacter sp. CFBP8995]|nr:DUF6402 family protein [Enterobacter sp. CFBP8995]